MDKEKNEQLKKEMKEKIEQYLMKIIKKFMPIYYKVLIDCLYDLAITNKELSKIALLKDEKNKKYGYTYKILKEHMDKNEVSRFFEDSLENIDDICSNDINKENKVNVFINSLFEDEN